MPITNCENRDVGQSHFWHPPVWKWGVFLVLVAGSGFLLVRKPELWSEDTKK